jgi:hypothetical protein
MENAGNKNLMILADGDMGEYRALKSCNVGEYLLRLETHIDEIDHHQKALAKAKR